MGTGGAEPLVYKFKIDVFLGGGLEGTLALTEPLRVCVFEV